MAKKIICIGLLLVMIFAFVGLGCSYDDLAAYKTAAKTTIETYAENKGQENYSVENWAVVAGLVADGKTAVDVAENKTGGDTAVKDAKDAISEVRKEGEGMFFTLQEAYDQALLTVGDLESVLYYRSVEYPESLSIEIEQAIKETYAKILRVQTYQDGTLMFPTAEINDVTVLEYYGTYNDCAAVVMNDSFTDYPAVVREETIAGVTFVYSGARITVWKA